MNRLSISLLQKEQRSGWVYLLLYTFILPNILSYVNLLLPHPLTEAKLNFLYFLINFISIIIIGWRFLYASTQMALKAPFRVLRPAFYGLVLYFLATFLLSKLILSIRPDFSNINDNSIAAMTQDNFTLISIGTVLLVPPVEEFLYRGLIFGLLYNRSKLMGFLVSIVLFAAIHVLGYIGSFDTALLGLCFLQYLPAGLFLGWAYAKADNIWAPILMHITINQIGMQTMR